MGISTMLGRVINTQPDSLWQKPLRLLRAIKRNPIRQFRIARRQKKLLRETYPAVAKTLIIFVNTSDDMVNGGVLAICAHYEETVKMRRIHGAETVLATPPDKRLLLKYTRFKNNNYIFGFSSVLSYFQALESVMIHIPEYMADSFLKDMSAADLARLRRIKYIHFNIMLQNIKGLRFMKTIRRLEELGRVTCTTAHEKYSTIELRREVGVPVHLLSIRGDPKAYNRRGYFEKDDLMIVSPDEHPVKAEVLRLLGEQLPKLKIRIISNLTYEEYKRLVEKAKWALTFGEGLDGYFTETIFSGGISFSVYNSAFFTEDFQALPTVYDSYDSLIRDISADIKRLDEEGAYAEYQERQFAICSAKYSYDKYFENLELFYKGVYTYK